MSVSRQPASEGRSAAALRSLAELRREFQHCDRNRDGRLQYSEFIELLTNLDAAMNSDDYRVAFTTIDGDRNGCIELDEFAVWWSQR